MTTPVTEDDEEWDSAFVSRGLPPCDDPTPATTGQEGPPRLTRESLNGLWWLFGDGVGVQVVRETLDRLWDQIVAEVAAAVKANDANWLLAARHGLNLEPATVVAAAVTEALQQAEERVAALPLGINGEPPLRGSIAMRAKAIAAIREGRGHE